MRFYGQHAQETAQRIVEAFREPGQLPKALAPIFIRRKDNIPCRQWSYFNQLAVVLAGTTDARGIRQWNQAGRKVKKGSTALWILAPCTKRIAEPGEKSDEEKHRVVLYGFRSVAVFAVEDTEGDPLPEPDPKYAEWVRELPLLQVAEAWGVNVDTYSHRGNNPLGYYRFAASGDQAIRLGVENLSTWCHELVHAADRKLTNLDGEAWRREVVAELGGAVLLECLGMTHDADLGGAFGYIEAYTKTADKDVVKACIEVLDRVCHCVKLILDTAEQAQPEAGESAALQTAV